MDRLEQVAEAIHEGWRDYQTRLGRVLGPERTQTTHPHMIPWSELDRESQNQDRFIAAVVLDNWALGLLAASELPAAIHAAWSRWVRIHGRAHPHAKPYEQAHASGAAEHLLQAERVQPLLRASPQPDERARK